MAGTEDRAQAARLLKIHKRNLERLEEQKARLAGAINLAVDNQIDEERANIAALDPIANPPLPTPSKPIQEFVAQASDGNWAMMFSQFVLLNSRITTIETKVQDVVEKVDVVVQTQSSAQLWRLDIADRLQHSDAARVHGQRRNFRISIGNITLILFVLLLALILFARAGLL